MMKRMLLGILLAFTLTSQLEASDTIKLGMLRFTSPPKLLKEADTITEIFTKFLSASEGLKLISRTRTIDDSDLAKISSFGKSEGCKYMLIGSVKLDRDIIISARVVDVETARVIFSTSAAAQKNDASSIHAESLKLADRVCEKLTERYPAYVSDVKGKDIYISRGSSSGVRKGDLYRVLWEISDLMDRQGNVTGMSRVDLAIIEVKSVNKTTSIANFFRNAGDERILSDNSSNITIKSSRVEAISKSEARKLIRDNNFSLEAVDDRMLELMLSSPINHIELDARVNGAKVPESELPELQENAEMGYPSAQYRLGLYYMERNNFPLALKWYQEAAKEHNIPALKDLGYMYEKGFGVAQDYTTAFEYYLRAAELGDAAAQASLGRLYRDGLGTEQDYRKAILWFEKSSAQGNESAKKMLDAMYKRGLGGKL